MSDETKDDDKDKVTDAPSGSSAPKLPTPTIASTDRKEAERPTRSGAESDAESIGKAAERPTRSGAEVDAESIGKAAERPTRSGAEGDAESIRKEAERPTRSGAEGDAESIDKALARKLRHRPKWKLFWIVSILSLVADQASKIWARAALDMEPIRAAKDYVCQVPDDISNHTCIGVAHPVIDSFWHWRLSMNPGSAFGLFSGQGQAGRILLSIVGIGAVFGMGWMLKKSRADQRVLHWALALVAGGAVGNLIDRIYYGVVTDFILWHWGGDHAKGQEHQFQTEWPVFNVADIVLVVGVGLMFIDIQKEGKREKAKKKRRQEKAKQAGLVKDL